MDNLLNKIVSLAKRRGFVFPSSEIYGRVEALYDYGPLGALMKNNIKSQWFKRFVQQREEVVAIDAAILMHPRVWEASGHLENFTDPLIECKNCHARLRADYLSSNQCPECGDRDFTAPRSFNLMFKTFLGSADPVSRVAEIYFKLEGIDVLEISEEEKKRKREELKLQALKAFQEVDNAATYLRPETAQSMFTNFRLVQESQRLQVPFGIAQVGKAFRNEITTGNYLFRLREFEQMEIEYFVKPGEDEKWFDYWVQQWQQFLLDTGLSKKNMRLYEHPKESLSHYSKRTVDIEYKFPFGWGELAGVANRTDFDLKQHAKFSGQDMRYQDPESKEKYYPFVIEPTMGVDRLFLALLLEGYEEVKGARTKTTEATKEVEVVLKLKPSLAPVQVAVLPLVKNKPELVKKAREVFDMLKMQFSCQYDEAGAIGRRYRRQDEIGTPYCITIDFDSLDKNDVTLRDRDTMNQERVLLDSLVEKIQQNLAV